ncbi:LysR family transcriptional regulator [Brevibacillus sp. NPDC003359]|uniref:LysR family transcriptional regulator n=1 Tax=unclassified Brevibacillus TaxID=2684853 RepID=UPI003697E38A
MVIRQLEYFIQICKEGSFTRAAEVLMVSQPTLSQQIRLLEHEFGITLFDRVGRGIEITEAGKILFEKSIAIMQTIEEARRETSKLKHIQMNEFIIGILPNDLIYLKPRIIKFQELYPNKSVKLTDIQDNTKQLLRNKIDVGISTYLKSSNQVDSIHLFDEELVLVVSEDHPWAEESVVPFRLLTDLESVLFVKDFKIRKQLYQYAKKLGISLYIGIEATSTSTLLKMVQSKVGVTILSSYLVNSYHCPKIKLIRLVDPTPTREIKLIYHKDNLIPHTTKAFIEYIRNSSKTLNLCYDTEVNV